MNPPSGQRRVPLLAPLADDLAAWRLDTGTPRRGYVFPQLSRCNWGRWLRREFRPAVKNAGRPKLAPQALSDAFAALLIEDGVTPSDVAMLMGIERGDVVDRYGYLLAATAQSGNAVDASERIREVRAGRPAPTPPTLIERISRLRPGGLLPRRLPTEWWNPSQWWDPSLPLKVETVESIRVRLLARNDQEAATFVSVMAYAGLRQLEARDLKWREVSDGELRIEIDPNAPEGERSLPRSIPLLGPVAADLIEWRSACGSPHGGWVFPELRARDWREWVGKVYRPAARPAERARRFPSHLCQTFWWLLADQGTSLEEAARQMGLDPEEGMDRYGDFFAEPGEQVAVSASARIQRVRATLSGGPLPSGSRGRGAKPFPLPRTSPAVREDLSAMQYQPPAPARPLPPAPPPSRARSV